MGYRLPDMTVTATPSFNYGAGGLTSFTLSGGGVVHMGHENAMYINNAPKYAKELIANGENVFDCAEQEDSLEFLKRVCEGFGDIKMSEVPGQLEAHWFYHLSASQTANSLARFHDENTQYFEAKNSEFLARIYGLAYRQYSQLTDTPTMHYGDLVGSISLPLTALYYWIAGDGRDRSIPLSSLNLHLRPKHLSGMESLLKSNPKVGRHNVSGRVEYNTFDEPYYKMPLAGTVGRISGSYQGFVDVLENGSYDAQISYTINADPYNADLGSGRSLGQEALTAFLKSLGEALGHKDYDIVFDGEVTTFINGKIQDL